MRTYDPAHGIRYVHLAVQADRTVDARLAVPGAPATSADPECAPLAAGYANDSLRTRLATPALRLLPGGAVTTGEPVGLVPTAAAGPALRLA